MTRTTVIRWERPPEPYGGGTHGKWVPLLEQLKDYPGRWALLLEDCPTCTADRFRKPTLVKPEGKFEFAQSGNKLYGRYRGVSHVNE